MKRFYFGQKKKIYNYLEQKKQSETLGAFDLLLEEYLLKNLTANLKKLNLKNVEIVVDFFTDYPCIGIQAKHGDYFIDLQIYQDEFFIAYSKDEPENELYYKLTSLEEFYANLQKVLLTLK